MKLLSEIPGSDREHFARCSVCESYFDMRDLSQVVEHQHWPATPEVDFSHSSKPGEEREVYVKGKRGMVTLREKSKEAPMQMPQQP